MIPRRWILKGYSTAGHHHDVQGVIRSLRSTASPNIPGGRFRTRPDHVVGRLNAGVQNQATVVRFLPDPLFFSRSGTRRPEEKGSGFGTGSGPRS